MKTNRIIDNLLKAIKNPEKVIRYLTIFLSYRFRKPKGTLVILGLESGGLFSLLYRGYEKCYCFEPNPRRFKELTKRYGKLSNIELYNVAVAQFDGTISFNISNNNNGASSSVGDFKKEWNQEYKSKKIEMVEKITVPCINLYHFCQENNISYINDYISDIQGMDLEVLKTLKPMIDKKRIGSICCEVAKDDKHNIYKGLPSNSRSEFEKILSRNYKIVAMGWGYLKDGKFDKIPDNAWEMDCKWRVNSTSGQL